MKNFNLLNSFNFKLKTMDINKLVSKLKRIKKYSFPNKEMVRGLFYEEKLREMNYVPKSGNADFWQFGRNIRELCPGIFANLYETRFSNVWFANNWLRGVFFRFYVDRSIGWRWFPLTKNWNFDVEDVVRQMQKINDLIPEWNKEFYLFWKENRETLQHELQKYNKTKQIGTNTAVILAKNRMRELGCEYQIEGQTLEIKLLHGRKFSISLPTNNMSAVKRILARIPQYADVINSVPDGYQIKNFSPNDMMAVGKAPADVDRLMRQLGYQYACAPQPSQTISVTYTLYKLFVSLPKKRELVVLQSQMLPQLLARQLDALPAYIDAINSVPSNFRIRKALPCDKWIKET